MQLFIFDKNNFLALFFSQVLVIRALDPNPDSLEMLDPDAVKTDPQHCLPPFMPGLSFPP
jgi:hypothetical protein